MKKPPRYLTMPSVQIDLALIKQLTSSIHKADVLGKFSTEDINKLTKHMVAVTVAEGEAIYVEGEPADYMGMLITGKLVVLKETQKGKSRQIADILPGRTVGEMSMVDGKAHSATVIAGQESIMVILSQGAMVALIDEDPRLGANLLRNLAATISLRLRSTNNILAQYLD